MTKLNLNSKLSEIRKELENKNINDINISLFSKKLPNKYAEMNSEDEKETHLNEIIYDSSGSKFLYLSKNSSPCWNYLNEECKLDYGCSLSFDGISKANKRAFEMKSCKFNLTGAERYKKGRLEFKSEEDWMEKTNLFFTTDISLQNIIGLGASIGKSRDRNFKYEISSTYKYTEIGKASLKFNKKNLELTDNFRIDVENAIKSEDPKKFLNIIEEYGQFIPTEVILGGRVYFKDDKISLVRSVDRTKESSGNIYIGFLKWVSNIKMGSKSSDSKKESSFYDFDQMKLIGGAHPEGKDFDDKAWIASLTVYQNWVCIEFRNPISIFQLLPDDLYKETFKLIGKKILYTCEDYCDYFLHEPGRYLIHELNLPQNVLNTILNDDADCDILAAVVDTKDSKNIFFNCQVLKKPKAEKEKPAKPSIIIYGIQKKFQKYKFKLKIKIMVVGYDMDFNFILPSIEVIENYYDPQGPCNFKSMELASNYNLLTGNIPFFGIPILENLNSSNNSLIIGHNFRKDDNSSKIDVFSYCLKKRCFVNLPKFTFHTLIILNNIASNAYELLPFEFSMLKNKPFIDLKRRFTSRLNPKYISLYLLKDNYKPFFLKQTTGQIKIKYVDCNCGETDETCFVCENKTLRISKVDNNIECIVYNCK
ncbi:hypothetical protein C1645_132041 [Glomus cerebriforme]|uniref:Uncharacterized protein n=1 Tax=Glomus cerebriforme TaxID=658196 RepID=A0A397SYY4_9GLOM|nr:hypothetical protein C1645_132041 [Glomus cerebriforme]